MLARSALPPREFDPADHALMVKAIKVLAMDGVEAAKSGHPGLPMGAADLAVTLWMRFLVHDPGAPDWADRDRFVLSAGHGSMLLYALLHLTGYDVSLDDLKSFRQLGSKTPGHPEFGETPGVEATTGPLGTGFAAGVGMAMAERYLAARFNREGHAIVDHFTYGIVSDGDLMEGIAHEAASFAGHQKLGKLIYLYDSNSISIDGSTDLAFTEDVGARFEALGWHVQRVDGHAPVEIAEAIAVAKTVSDAPSLVVCTTIIGQGSPNKGGTEHCHGAPLGSAEIELTKKALGWPTEPAFFVPEDLVERIRSSLAATADLRGTWNQRFAAYRAAHPEPAAELEMLLRGDAPASVDSSWPKFDAGKAVATRKSSGTVLAALAAAHPGVIGGSADLAGSNGVSLMAQGISTPETPAGRHVHFGVREHGMAGICNGMALHGGLVPVASTFLIFSDFLRGALRLSALMRLPVVYVLSHDSIFVGEDGPTHQPVEQCMSLRMIPDLFVVRPADANEVVGAWRLALQRKLGQGPTAILVTRQNVPDLGTSRQDISCGAYVLWDPPGVAPEDLDGILLATGSEVSLAREAAERLLGRGRAVRVVSMPCWEAFEAQDDTYRRSVLPDGVTRRLSIEAGTTLGWHRYAAHTHGIDRFGACGPAAEVAEKFGFSPEAVCSRYLELP